MAFYDYFAKSKGTKIGNKLKFIETEKAFKFIKKHLDSKKDKIEILEIGPGRGDLANIFMKDGFKNYDVVEPNDIIREELIEKGVRNAKSYFIPELKEKDNKYDLIVLFHVFEHLRNHDQAQFFIKEASRVLKKDGILAILCPDFMDQKEHFFNCDFSHSNPTTVRRCIQLFTDNDFKTLSFKYYYSCFEGLIGILFSKIVKLFSYFSLGNKVDSKIYKAKLTFSRKFLILGQIKK